jgi:hypothetical protein
MRLSLFAVAAVASLSAAGAARADAVPPPPDSCPKGHVGVTDHGGPRCVLEAPKNCPPGYRGALGGKCVLATCGSDDQCEGGRRCLQIETCQEFRELRWTGWGWSAQRTPPPRDNLLAEPPSPQPDGPPKKAWVQLHICGQDGPCNAPAECRPAPLCYPPDAVGKTQAKAAPSAAPSAASGEADASPSEDAPGETYVDESASPVTAAAPESGGGCRKGCSAGSTAAALGWIGLPLLASLGWWRRKRRVRAPDPRA